MCLFSSPPLSHCQEKVTCDESGITYYDNDRADSLRNPLGFIDCSEILTVCDMGNMKKRDFCIEVITKERTWYFWADTKAMQVQWIDALTKCKEAGKTRVQPTKSPRGSSLPPKSPRGSALNLGGMVSGLMAKTGLRKSGQHQQKDDLEPLEAGELMDPEEFDKEAAAMGPSPSVMAEPAEVSQFTTESFRPDEEYN